MSYYHYGLGQISPLVSTAVPVSSRDAMPALVEVGYEIPTTTVHRAPPAPMEAELHEILVQPMAHRAPAVPDPGYIPPPAMSMTPSGPSSKAIVPGVEMPYKPSAPPLPGNGALPTNGLMKCLSQGGVHYDPSTGKCYAPSPTGTGLIEKKPAVGVGTVAVAGAAALAALLLMR